nr:hypothetical protein Iba_chr05aCG17410 [Ipomoea batatas]GMC96515.1 hypothetical protein Iba_chr05cCG18790 [Ipomoea batatas]GMC98721.1 hypothetical protein Iba_chr05dCG18840 [Ipomoea batatas]
MTTRKCSLYALVHFFTTSNLPMVISKDLHQFTLALPIIQWLNFNGKICINIISSNKIRGLLCTCSIVKRSIFHMSYPLKIATGCAIN